MLGRLLQRARSEYGAFRNRYRDVTDAERQIPRRQCCRTPGHHPSACSPRFAPSSTGAWAIASLDDVKRNVRLTRYPEERITFVKGPVEQTLNATAPDHIAVLRLDTDWYESTKAELDHLYPRLAIGGVLIIDDYGHWQGARRAVDEYFAARGEHPFLHRTDYTGRVMIKMR